MHSFSAIPVFVAVVENGSFSVAAAKLNITKSAVSKRVNQLEDELGIRLLNRTTRKLSLTEAGQRYYDYVSQALGLAQQGLDAVTELQGSPQGRLKISVPMGFGVKHVAPIIADFIELNSQIEIDLQLEDQMVDLIEGGFDLAIRIGHLPVSNLVARRLAPCKSLLCASPIYLEQYGEPKRPTDLAHHNCLRYSYFRGGHEWTFESVHGEHKVVPKGNFVVNNSEVIRRTVLDGLGIAQLPTFIVASDIAKGTLIPVMQDFPLPEHAIYAVFPERKHLPLKVRTFIEYIADRLGTDTPYWDQLIATP
ncbi:MULTISPECIES: LysR family transcriptional regulator [Vibrio]|uniref:Putative LysR family transcriptional regulator n=1 Tax=Vibrio proteolyticus NBRC 13287 TaxID=1219065 RepID=U3BKB2_VIBPR|nr:MULTISPECIES: LysR family transcriptional regulator [Vibrio]NAW57230.1 LysR family transcriptional regulator [Vibrio sp. V36_P2S2PM302]NAX23549.1 LysR family transcriptional regulator [Vibrio sp. V39_P1S14PM300]NAX26526.1 LysR family transcriptional regulator [Vibrio sp. V38_P2S17PM301]NAX29132.1 LysR family transcriptional regulator [Vibrio sp. V37_P2S8PM304]GAD67063.1 putative LysR family transcriptional regulator [Vibrio proteolyticus NBRC 13287]